MDFPVRHYWKLKENSCLLSCFAQAIMSQQQIINEYTPQYPQSTEEDVFFTAQLEKAQKT